MAKRIFNPLVLLILLLGLTAQARKANVRQLLPAKGSYRSNVVYKHTPQGALCLDIYHPDTTQTGQHVPLVVFIHGGSWMHGNKGEILEHFQSQMLKSMLDDGIAVISINYRLANDSLTVTYPAPLSDCKDAVRWVRANAESLHIDPSRIGVMGTSAGGHLAMLTAYAPDSLAPEKSNLSTHSAAVKCCVDIYGPTHLGKMLRPTLTPTAVALASIFMGKQTIKMRQTLLWSFTGESSSHPWKRQRKCSMYSPLSYVCTAVPTLTFHGNKDRTVPFNQSKMLKQAMDKQGKYMELTTIDGQDHTFPTISEARISAMCAQLVTFLNQYLKGQ